MSRPNLTVPNEMWTTPHISLSLPLVWLMTQNPCQVTLSRYGIVRSWHPCHVMPGHDTICHILYLSWYYLSHHVKSWYYLPCHVKSLYCHVSYLSWYYLSCHVSPVLTLSKMLCHSVTLSILAMTQLVSNDSQSCHGVPTPTVMSRQAMTHSSWLTVMSRHFLSCSCESVTHLESCHVTSCHGPVSLWLTLSHVTLPPVMVLWVCDSPWVMSRYLLSWSCESVTRLESCHVTSCHGPVSPWLTLSHVMLPPVMVLWVCDSPWVMSRYLLSWSCESVTHLESCHITSCNGPAIIRPPQVMAPLNVILWSPMCSWFNPAYYIVLCSVCIYKTLFIFIFLGYFLDVSFDLDIF